VTDNSAEREAEKILEDAYAEARAEECPQGDQCPVHFRVDEEYVVESEKYARYITYVGEYAVVTEDNHILESPVFIVKMLLGQIKKEDMPPRFETTIFFVGSGTIGDLTDKDAESQRESIRYASTHDVWEQVGEEHAATVLMLESGLIDVSKSLED
jgi:hypothetical protein